MRITVVNVELLPPIVEAFAQCPFYLHTTRNVDVFQSLCGSRRVCQWQSSSPSYGQQCAPRQPHPPPAGIIFWSARWLETSEFGYPVTRRRHYTVRPLQKLQNSKMRLFVRLRDPFLFSGDCSRRTKLNCHSAVYLEVVINQSSEHDWELWTVTIFDIYGSCESVNWLMLVIYLVWWQEIIFA